MNYTFYTTSEKAWGAMLEAISGARVSIFLEMYIFIDNTDKYNFFELLAQKAREGIAVKIIVDSFGSQELDSKTIEKIKKAGAEVLFFSYWLRRMHKKVLVVDEKTAFLGGVNIHKLFQKWNDLQVRFTGRMVKSIVRSFAKNYRICGGKDPNILAYYHKKNIFKKTRMWFLQHRQSSGDLLLKKRYQEKLASAQKSVVIVTPYFAPRRWLFAALHQAVLRGALVSILVPRRTDHWIFNRVNYFYVLKLQRMGVVFYLHKNMNHAKAMLIDDTEGAVGSQNIDPLSFGYNVEAGIFFRDKQMVRELGGIIGAWKQNCVVFDPSMHKKTWFDYLLAPLISVFQSLV
ncbi:phosphatidylserine/phosphatidylglycerophosphate/cardiolipin synthase family protein [Candidatus Azambacteria bacterium]|nr:phosphatidylserine/phosphatidylglycerophosphate/cardiolipin synthase family protein [Candidatus Azambacteria bacterium]MBI3685347.1 phosphatidylserine/phosphatidylglycerophosphate/cardiolipin synthase family protein [Candidatus Azambacteria bacterium]